MTRLLRAVPDPREQVYGDWWTVADLPTQPVTTSPTDCPPPSSSSHWGTRVLGHAPGERFEKRPSMRSSSQQSGARPSVLIRDPLAEDLVGASGRHAKAPTSPQL